MYGIFFYLFTNRRKLLEFGSQIGEMEKIWNYTFNYNANLFWALIIYYKNLRLNVHKPFLRDCVYLYLLIYFNSRYNFLFSYSLIYSHSCYAHQLRKYTWLVRQFSPGQFIIAIENKSASIRTQPIIRFNFDHERVAISAIIWKISATKASPHVFECSADVSIIVWLRTYTQWGMKNKINCMLFNKFLHTACNHNT